jgi:nitroimidazol reductase NimA-like FMN-containing flavoprotein (pyridoxamine 5'-phosphate oxidase superfamily)
MEAEEELTTRLRELFRTQGLAVLSTHGEGGPYASLVGFAATEDLKSLLFATSRSTRKYANLMGESHAAMLVDSRSNQDSDFHNAIAVTATGRTEEVTAAERDALLKTYLDKHPHLTEFVSAPTCALLHLAVDTYYVVERFQHVVEIHVKR